VRRTCSTRKPVTMVTKPASTVARARVLPSGRWSPGRRRKWRRPRTRREVLIAAAPAVLFQVTGEPVRRLGRRAGQARRAARGRGCLAAARAPPCLPLTLSARALAASPIRPVARIARPGRLRRCRLP
jgi:hypothetical protein